MSVGDVAGAASSFLASVSSTLSTPQAALTGKILTGVFAGLGASNLLSYVVPQVVTQTVRSVQELGKKYETEWAVVTGASSGLGEAIAEKLLSQGTNVVLVALDNSVLAATGDRLAREYPQCEVRVVGVNMADSDACLEAVVEATKDIQVGLLFNNAGYVYIESFEHADLGKQLANIHVLLLSSVKLTDHFYKAMIKAGSPGGICFTSSQASFFPSPLSTVYSGSKAFLSAYAQALHVEGAPHGIDVLSLQPGYMRSNFIDDLPDLSIWNSLEKIGQYPHEVADNVFRAMGRITLLDSGTFSWGSRLITKVIDLNPLVDIVTYFSNQDDEFNSFHGKDAVGEKDRKLVRTAPTASAKASATASASASPAPVISGKDLAASGLPPPFVKSKL